MKDIHKKRIRIAPYEAIRRAHDAFLETNIDSVIPILMEEHAELKELRDRAADKAEKYDEKFIRGKYENAKEEYIARKANPNWHWINRWQKELNANERKQEELKAGKDKMGLEFLLALFNNPALDTHAIRHVMSEKYHIPRSASLEDYRGSPFRPKTHAIIEGKLVHV